MTKNPNQSKYHTDSISGFNETDDRAFLEWAYQKILCRGSDEQGRIHYLARLAQGMPRITLIEELFASAEYNDRFAACKLFPPGHVLSPLPSGAEIEAHDAFDWHPSEIPAIDLRIDEQKRLIRRLARHYPLLPFQSQPTCGQRYYYENSSYSYADAIFLACIILEFRPQRIIEVGSGFSSAAMLDISDRFFKSGIDFLFIDPDTSRLRQLQVKNTPSARILEVNLQDVPLAVFDRLGSRDILFVDSSHVSKLNSDVNRIFFDILPRLKKGVLVHIHDVFYPFEYPKDWLQRGWVWNEQYLLHAFLQYNSAFAIRLFSSLMFQYENRWFAENMPDCLKNPGGSLWIEKII